MQNNINCNELSPINCEASYRKEYYSKGSSRSILPFYFDLLAYLLSF